MFLNYCKMFLTEIKSKVIEFEHNSKYIDKKCDT